MSDLVSRTEAIAKIEKAMCEDGFRSGTGLVHKTTVYEILRSLPDAQPNEDKRELTRTITAGIIATSTKDVYSCGMRNGM